MSLITSLKTRLLHHELAFIGLVLVMAIIGFFGSHYWSGYSQESQRIATLQDTVQRINGLLYRQIKEVTHASSMQDPEAKERNQIHFSQVQLKFRQLYKLSLRGSERQAISELEALYLEIQQKILRLLALSPIKREAQRIKLLSNDYQTGVTIAFDQRLQQFSSLNQSYREQIYQRLNEQLNILMLLTPLPILIAIAFVFLSRRALKTEVLEPLTTLRQGAEQLSRNGLQRPETGLGITEFGMVEKGVEELRALAATMNAMVEELEQSRRLLLEKERQAVLGSLVPVVAHNIRNPLAGIRATAQLLDEEVDTAELLETKNDIIQTVDRLERWVTALLRYLNPLRQMRTDVVLVDFLQSVVDSVQHRLDEKRLELVKKNWQREWIVNLDPDLMEQAIHGLLLNAIEASPEQSRMTLAMELAQSGMVIILEDQGMGISFTPDPQNLMPGPSTKKMGTGLGLPFAYKVIRAHGWEISLINKQMRLSEDCENGFEAQFPKGAGLPGSLASSGQNPEQNLGQNPEQNPGTLVRIEILAQNSLNLPNPEKN